MNEPPVMLSTKDLSYISDMFEWNFVACKTSNHLSTLVGDKEIKDLLERVSKMHSSICKNLVKMLGVTMNNKIETQKRKSQVQKK